MGVGVVRVRVAKEGLTVEFFSGGGVGVEGRHIVGGMAASVKCYFMAAIINYHILSTNNTPDTPTAYRCRYSGKKLQIKSLICPLERNLFLLLLVPLLHLHRSIFISHIIF